MALSIGILCCPRGVNTDELKVKFMNGILEITVPAPARAKACKIEVEAQWEDDETQGSETKKAA